VLAGAAAALLVAVAAGCGQSNGTRAEGSDQVEIKTVAASTEAAGTARLEGSFQPRPGSGSPAGHFEGEIDFADGRSSVRSTYDALGKEAPHQTETRTVDGYTYFEAPPEMPEGFPGIGSKPWYRVRLPGSSIGMLPMGGSADVTGYLELLESMGARTEVVGTETVRDTPTTRYRVTLGAPPDLPAQIAADGRFRVEDDQSGSVDLWADELGRLRRFRTDFGTHDDGGGGGRYEVDVSDYGAPVSIEAPPLDQVADQPVASLDPDAFEKVASGSSDGSTWKLFASTSGDTRCFAVEADVPKYFAAVLGAEDGRVGLGCSSSATGIAAPGADPNGVVETSSVSIDPQAVPLANGRALLVSNAPEGTTEVTLRLRGGGERKVEPAGAYFGAVLAHDEVVDTIVFGTPSGTKQCRLDERFGYDCDGGSGSGSTTHSSGSGSDSSSTATTTAPATTSR
jgi:hypothetical protein